ncbi:class I SAM-dependent methyltransferase [Paenibacillus pabuli]|uniref:class I SAM-dependent methyltransferase n=2 Tax=Paenibacillus pabuli TaxID=1472 RepID=UPI001FDFD7D6|nr:class I SAM-dependent methyltransferase [Paenibacillus pabuli]
MMKATVVFMQSINQWQADEYDNKLAFVSGYGKNLISWLQPRKGEYILDLGCGTGDLTYEISRSQAEVVGMDSSADMICRAREKFPDIEFIEGDGHQFETSKRYDAVFSNAALHWMRSPHLVVDSIWNSLKPGGRFVAEFGGKGNVQIIVDALEEVFERHTGIRASERNPWYFPTIGQYSHLLEQCGFLVRQAYHYDRPTRLVDGEQGIEGWLAHFGGDYFEGLAQEKIQEICRETSKIALPKLWKEDAIYADYKRLRIEAVKPGIEIIK